MRRNGFCRRTVFRWKDRWRKGCGGAKTARIQAVR
ncbi:hypothetical protein ACFPMF_26575 [Larkinella bovis]|uniref:Helix-turn-helix domain-containing protein n=1 Tax=Larkinella bovis TaxID=683041 RepID=A0ABW0IHE9_9BACT